jgi:hypothetical protein
MGKMPPKKDPALLEVYKDLSVQIRSEISEFYKIHAAFLVSIGAIGSVAAAIENPHSLLFDAGALISIAWLICIQAAVRWRGFWIARAAAIEKELWGEYEPAKRVNFTTDENDPRLSWQAVADTKRCQWKMPMNRWEYFLSVDLVFRLLAATAAVAFILAAILS